MPACHTIKVVISPNGLKAPPAFAATTIFIQPIEMNLALPFPHAITTETLLEQLLNYQLLVKEKK